MSFGSAVTLVIATFADAGTHDGGLHELVENGRERGNRFVSALPWPTPLPFCLAQSSWRRAPRSTRRRTAADFLPLLSGHGPWCRRWR